VRSGTTSRPAGPPDELSPTELAAKAGVSSEEVERLVTFGILIPRDGSRPFRAIDALKIRVARACEEGGLPMEGMAEAVRAGLLSFAFVESWPFERWSSRRPQTHLELAEEVGLSFEALQRLVEAFGFARPEPKDVVVEAERPIALLAGRIVELEIVDEAGLARLGARLRGGLPTDRPGRDRGLPLRGGGAVAPLGPGREQDHGARVELQPGAHRDAR
jgi:hypothetical protein